MIPFFDQPVLDLGPVDIHAYGVLVAVAVVLGFQWCLSRAVRRGADPAEMESFLTWTLVVGFVGAHLYSVFAYFPDELARDPLLLFRVWEDLSSVGGMMGGVVGMWIFFYTRRERLGAEGRWFYLDTVAFALPFSWAVGRLGCTVAHDHPGRITDFFLARSLESPGARAFIRRVYEAAGQAAQLPPADRLAELAYHDLGWYEFLYLAAVMVPLFLWLDRKDRTDGFYAAAFLLTYAPVRFLLDFLRVADPRYAGLTPAQWVALAGLAAGIVLWRRRVTAAGPGAGADAAAG